MTKFFLIIFAILLLVGGYFFYQRMMGKDIDIWRNDTQTVEETTRATAIMAETNTWRQNRVLPPLRVEEQLCSFSLRRAEELTKDSTKSFDQFLQKNGIKIAIPYESIGQLTGNGADPVGLVRQWGEDTTNQLLLESSDFSHGCIRCKKEMCVLLLIRPE